MVLIIQFRFLPIVLAAVSLVNPAASVPIDEERISAEACVLMAEDGQCLFEKNADARHLIASTTKLMTALVVLENAELTDHVQILERHCLVEGSSMYLKPGESYTVRELLLGLMLSSGNDAALALADHVGRSEAGFVRLMNRKAAELGLIQTHFENPHGLDAKGHASTARDLARLMFRCMENSNFRALVSTKSATVHGLTLINHNRLLTQYPGCIGGKTGYTMAAGRCLVSCCERDGLRLVCVTLSAPDDWNDHRKLYDRAFRDYVLFDPCREISQTVPILSGSRATARVVPAEQIRLIMPRDAKLELQAVLPRFAFAPIHKGEQAGSLKIVFQGRTIRECPLLYEEEIPLAWPCFYPTLRKEYPL